MWKILASILVFNSSIGLISTGFHNKWTFELIEIDIIKIDPEVMDAHFDIVRIGRGKFGLSGFVDLKIDFYDNITLGATIERSKYRAGPYTLTPMAVQHVKFSVFMNNFYKRVMQPVLENCSENAPIIKDTFVQPLTKRYINVSKCEYNTDNMPSIVMEGYYKYKAFSKGAVESAVNVLILVENELF